MNGRACEGNAGQCVSYAREVRTVCLGGVPQSRSPTVQDPRHPAGSAVVVIVALNLYDAAVASLTPDHVGDRLQRIVDDVGRNPDYMGWPTHLGTSFSEELMARWFNHFDTDFGQNPENVSMHILYLPLAQWFEV